VLNPATGAVIGKLPLADAADLDRALAVADEGFRIWRKSTPMQRAAVLAGAAGLLVQRQEEIARAATLEQGKTIAETRIEVMMVAGLFNFYAGETQRVYGRTLPRPDGMRSTVTYEPVGPVAAFAPWNFPIGNPGRKLGAPIAAGCSVILKPAEETPASALAVLQALLDAGLPPQVAQAVFGVPDEVSRHLLASPVIRKLSFTGSTVVGKHLAKLAADNCIARRWSWAGMGRCWSLPMRILTAFWILPWATNIATPGKSASAPRASLSRKACSNASAMALPRAPRRSPWATAGRRRAWGRWPTPPSRSDRGFGQGCGGCGR
jgi:succinate-semialdehyde dehydrogenase/glutarate-semialdehyde dehydrogenase